MRSFIFTGLVSLLLLAGTVALWVRSFRQCDIVAGFNGSGRLNGIGSDRGTLLFFFSSIPFGSERAWSIDIMTVQQAEFRSFDDDLYSPNSLKFKMAGFKAFAGSYSPTAGGPAAQGIVAPPITWPYSGVTIPDWFVVALLSCPAWRWLHRMWQTRRRRKRGQCLVCGYDLRGTAGRCPECGTAVAAKAGLATAHGGLPTN